MRLFVGIGLPDEVREGLAALRWGLPGARWVEPGNLHLTLRFIGEADNGEAEDLDAALAAVRHSAFDLSVSGLGCFQSRSRVRVLWAGTERSEALAGLRDKVESALVRAGQEPERRKFKGHITLARCKDTPIARVAPYLETHDGYSAGPFPVDRFILYSSTLGRKGAHYDRLADYTLMPGG